MNKIILLGGTGFLGKALLPMLQKENFQVITLLHKNNSNFSTDTFSGDICNPELLDSKLDDGDIIVNLIGQYEKNISKFIDNNILGAFNILNSVVKKKNVKIIVISSISVYGENLKQQSKESDVPNPYTNYGIVKFATEKIYRHFSLLHNIDVTILRLSTLYGPFKKTGHIVNLIKSISNNTTTTAYNNGNQIRDLLFVNDAANGIICTINNLQKGFNIFNISSGKQYKILDIIKIIEEISKTKLSVKLSDKIPDERSLCAENSLSKKEIGFIPKTSLEEGLRLTIEHFQKNANI